MLCSPSRSPHFFSGVAYFLPFVCRSFAIKTQTLGASEDNITKEYLMANEVEFHTDSMLEETEVLLILLPPFALSLKGSASCPGILISPIFFVFFFQESDDDSSWDEADRVMRIQMMKKVCVFSLCLYLFGDVTLVGVSGRPRVGVTNLSHAAGWLWALHLHDGNVAGSVSPFPGAGILRSKFSAVQVFMG